ncbi:shikimate kinase [Falsihalocynthiibacter sp. SS001]|uniref:shikimate kinase n=1 Tax=Falsihalocynthiibacter sp. SS001 TaxID=3349698 RepID=UPI0036D2FD80
MMGAGKTAVGKSLAAILNVPFLDSDEEIVKAANMSIAEIFERDGEAFFRQRETEVITRLLKEERGILSTGGGAFLSERNRKIIAETGYSLWLQADLDLLWSRVRHKNTRPLLQTDNPYETLKSIYKARVPAYEKARGCVSGHPDYSIEDMRDAVLEKLLSEPDLIKVTE